LDSPKDLWAPNANAYPGRFVRSIKEECLDRLIRFGERHFRRTVAAFVDHYHRKRNHQGVGNEVIEGHMASGLTPQQVFRVSLTSRFHGSGFFRADSTGALSSTVDPRPHSALLLCFPAVASGAPATSSRWS
jgi:hypothetical protein